jgi:hypothetical protein
LVCETVREMVPVTETYCEMVPYKTKVKVAVAVAPPPCGH